MTPRYRSKNFPLFREGFDWWRCGSRSPLSFPSKSSKNQGREGGGSKLSSMATIEVRGYKKAKKPVGKKAPLQPLENQPFWAENSPPDRLAQNLPDGLAPMYSPCSTQKTDLQMNSNEKVQNTKVVRILNTNNFVVYDLFIRGHMRPTDQKNQAGRSKTKLRTEKRFS